MVRDCKLTTLPFTLAFSDIFDWTAANDVVRRDHAREAVRFWTAVVERTGSSRFDVEKAREQLKDAQQVLRRRKRKRSISINNTGPSLTKQASVTIWFKARSKA
jgi:hypothetical protein